MPGNIAPNRRGSECAGWRSWVCKRKDPMWQFSHSNRDQDLGWNVRTEPGLCSATVSVARPEPVRRPQHHHAPRPDAGAVYFLRGADWTRPGEWCWRLVRRLLSPVAPSLPSGLSSDCTFDFDPVHERELLPVVGVKADCTGSATGSGSRPRFGLRKLGV